MITFAKLGQYGRLGNCQFQMAATIATALKNNDDYIFPHFQYEHDLNEKKYSNNIKYNKTFEELDFTYHGIPYQKNLNLHGYFQSYKYFQDFPIINDLVSPKYKFDKINATSIHVRRTDYLTHKDCYTLLDHNYYNKAMEICNDNLYYIFSDDINYCKSIFKGNNFEFIYNDNPAIDQAMMLSCNNNIIANSSFSWWAAWLNKNQNKKVIAPINWFGPKLPLSTKDLIPENWIKI